VRQSELHDGKPPEPLSPINRSVALALSFAVLANLAATQRLTEQLPPYFERHRFVWVPPAQRPGVEAVPEDCEAAQERSV
jgi:hypothetical protein